MFQQQATSNEQQDFTAAHASCLALFLITFTGQSFAAEVDRSAEVNRFAPVKLIKDQATTLTITFGPAITFSPGFPETNTNEYKLSVYVNERDDENLLNTYKFDSTAFHNHNGDAIKIGGDITVSKDQRTWQMPVFAETVNYLIEQMATDSSIPIIIDLYPHAIIARSEATCASGIIGCPDPAVVEAEKAKAAATSTLNATRDSALHLSRNSIAALQQRLGQLRHQNPDHNRLRIDFADPRLQALARALPLQSDLTPAAMGPWQPWVAGKITVGEQDNTDLDITLNALHTGIDRSHDRYHYGFALSLQNQQSKGSGLKLKTQQTAIASYGSMQFGRWPQSLEGIIGMGNLSSDIDRTTTQAKRAGKQTYASITYRLSFQHDQIQLSPYGRYDWHRITLDAYEESGDADNALVLGYAAETVNASFLAMGLGADFNRDQALQPFLQLEYATDLTNSGDSEVYYLSNPDTRYTLAGRSDSPSQWSLDLGLRYHLPRLRLDFRYGRHQSSDTTLNSLALSANWRF